MKPTLNTMSDLIPTANKQHQIKAGDDFTNLRYCHSERSEESEIVVGKPVSSFRFLALLEMTNINYICEIDLDRAAEGEHDEKQHEGLNREEEEMPETLLVGVEGREE